VKSLCTRGVVLEHGSVKFEGEINEAVDYYLSNNIINKWFYKNPNIETSAIRFVEVVTSSKNGIHDFNEDIKINIDVFCETKITDPAVSYQILNSDNIPLVHELNLNSENEFCNERGVFRLTSTISKLKLYQGNYKLNVYFADNFTKKRIDTVVELCDFEIINTNKRTYYWQKGTAQYKENNTNWKVEKKINLHL
jgi:lipopolysaccharide transport system ATP-binding protein